MATPTPTPTAAERVRSTRRLGPFVLDAALTVLAAALVVLVFAVAPGPDVCAASLPTPGPCLLADRNLIAFVTIVSVLVLLGTGFIANHLLGGRARRLTIGAAVLIAASVGALGASSLAFSFWIIWPLWQL